MVFIILVLINFMVITKGAGRIAEVGARFVLDGMPGKQMAIDADLNAGLIGEDEAKKRRAEVTQEADFYGSMDGASKFVRGDAIAGLMIMVLNVVGGLLVGVVQHGMELGAAAESYTLLTIGDGLVAQIPALVISTAAGVIVTRVATDQDVGEQMVGQLFNNPRVMLLSAGVLGLLGLVPGMPNLVFLLFTAALLGLAWWLRGREQQAPKAVEAPVMPDNPQAAEASWADVQLEDPLGMEVGYRLIPMVDFQQNGELLGRIRGIRKKFAQDMGYLPPVVHIRDNLELPPASYRILMKGVEIGSGEAQPAAGWRSTPAMPWASWRETKPSIRLLGSSGVDRQRIARAGADPGLYRGGSQHRGGDTPQSPDRPVRQRAVWPPGNPTVAGSRVAGDAETDRRLRAGRGITDHAAQGAAKPAGRACFYPRYAHHRRNAGGACSGAKRSL